MRTAPAIALGVVLGAALAGAMAFGFMRLWPDAWISRVAGKVEPVPTVARRPPTVSPAVGSTTSVASPVTPAYGTRIEGPAAIYRCRANGHTTYSDVPCPGADRVQGMDAATGFDSRPSERLGRLVAAGRAADADDRRSTGPSNVSVRSAQPVSTSRCSEMRRQIVDIDRQMLEPNSLRTLDDLRRVRQDVRTSMAREHC